MKIRLNFVNKKYELINEKEIIFSHFFKDEVELYVITDILFLKNIKNYNQYQFNYSHNNDILGIKILINNFDKKYFTHEDIQKMNFTKKDILQKNLEIEKLKDKYPFTYDAIKYFIKEENQHLNKLEIIFKELLEKTGNGEKIKLLIYSLMLRYKNNYINNYIKINESIEFLIQNDPNSTYYIDNSIKSKLEKIIMDNHILDKNFYNYENIKNIKKFNLFELLTWKQELSEDFINQYIEDINQCGKKCWINLIYNQKLSEKFITNSSNFNKIKKYDLLKELIKKQKLSENFILNFILNNYNKEYLIDLILYQKLSETFIENNIKNFNELLFKKQVLSEFFILNNIDKINQCGTECWKNIFTYQNISLKTIDYNKEYFKQNLKLKNIIINKFNYNFP